jgi:magnesium transporter
VRAEHLNQPIAAFAGREFTALARDLTVGAALAQIRERGVAEQIIYFYVMDADGRLAGVVPTRRLLTAPLEARLSDIMVPRVVAIPETATVLEACEMFVLHKFLAFPVVNATRQLVGVVNVNLFTGEVFDLTEKERMDDVFQTIGFRVAEAHDASPARSFRLRFPWLVATLTGGLGCAWLAGLYETTLAASLILAIFLALVLGLGESVAAQSVTVTVQALHGRRPDWPWFAQALRREVATALLLGSACGLLVGLAAWGWRGRAAVAFVIGGSIAASMLLACLIGLAVPALLHRFKLDPKIAAGPVSLALADIFTLLIYFNLARLVL